MLIVILLEYTCYLVEQITQKDCIRSLSADVLLKFNNPYLLKVSQMA